eukprot:SAG11_NODE_93_length_17080_cov_10.504093_16_plen_711_part_00
MLFALCAAVKELCQGLMAARLKAEPLCLPESLAWETATNLASKLSEKLVSREKLVSWDEPLVAISEIIKSAVGAMKNEAVDVIEFLMVRLLTKKLQFKTDLAASFVGELLRPTAVAAPDLGEISNLDDISEAVEGAVDDISEAIEDAVDDISEAIEGAAEEGVTATETMVATAKQRADRVRHNAQNSAPPMAVRALGKLLDMNVPLQCLSMPVLQFIRLLGTGTSEAPPIEAYNTFVSVSSNLLHDLEQFDLLERLKVDLPTDTFVLIANFINTDPGGLEKLANVAVRMQNLQEELDQLEKEPFEKKRQKENMRREVLAEKRRGQNLDTTVPTKMSIEEAFKSDLLHMAKTKQQKIEEQARLPKDDLRFKGVKCYTPLQCELLKALVGGTNADALATQITSKQLLLIRRLHEIHINAQFFAAVKPEDFARLGDETADMDENTFLKFGQTVQGLVGLAPQTFSSLLELPKVARKRLLQLHKDCKIASAIRDALRRDPSAYAPTPDRIDSFAASKTLMQKRLLLSANLAQSSADDVENSHRIDAAMKRFVAVMPATKSLEAVELLLQFASLGDKAETFIAVAMRLPPMAEAEIKALKALTPAIIKEKLSVLAADLGPELEEQLSAKKDELVQSMKNATQAQIDEAVTAVRDDLMTEYQGEAEGEGEGENQPISDIVPLLFDALNRPEYILSSLCDIIEVTTAAAAAHRLRLS